MCKDSENPDQNLPQDGHWHIDLCQCYHSPCTCLITWACPCCYAGINAGDTDCCPSLLGMCCFFVPVVGHVMMSQTRKRTRKMYRIPGNFCGDFAATCFCTCCSIIQNRTQLEQPLPRKVNVNTVAINAQTKKVITEVPTAGTLPSYY